MRIGDACRILTGYTSRGRLQPAEQGGSLVLQLGDVALDGHVDPDRLTRVAFDDLPKRYLVGLGDVIFRSRGVPNIAVALDDRFVERPVAVLPLFVLRPKPEIILPEYLAWVINQPTSQRHFDRVARGTTMRMVPRSGLEILEISVPSIETQRRIVAIDALAERERTLSILAANKRRTSPAKSSTIRQREQIRTRYEKGRRNDGPKHPATRHPVRTTPDQPDHAAASQPDRLGRLRHLPRRRRCRSVQGLHPRDAVPQVHLGPVERPRGALPRAVQRRRGPDQTQTQARALRPARRRELLRTVRTAWRSEHRRVDQRCPGEDRGRKPFEARRRVPQYRLQLGS